MRNHLFKILSLAFLLPAFFAFGQPAVLADFSQGTISGKVVDALSESPLGYATVSVFLQKDSTLVNGTITDDAGRFALEVRSGTYFASIEFLSFQPKIITGIEVTKEEPNVDLGIIKLEEETTILNEVVVQAEKSHMQLALDKKIFNVGKDLANAGGTAVEILDNIPSVMVDVEGNVSLRGSGNVRILIDGKPSSLTSTGGLRQLQANMVEKVEVITNPSARYEAEGMAGIINIVLRKEQQNGINGAVDLTVGTPDNYGVSFNMNYRRNKLNLFTNYGISYRKHPGKNTQYQEFYDGDTTYITDLVNKRERGGLSNNFRFGADYYLNTKNILTAALSYRHRDNNNSASIIYRDFINSLQNPTGVTTRSDKQDETEPNLEYSLNYKKLFGREGHELVADFEFEGDTEDQSSNLTEQHLLPDLTPSGEPDLLQRTSNKERQKEFIVKVDYVLPINKDGKFETGTQNSFRNIKNDYLVEEFNDFEWVTLAGLSNNFIYEENIYAAYAMYGNKVSRFSFQLGLRAEHSQVKTELLQTKEINDRNYTNLFPSAHLSYEFANENAVQLSYSRRLRRPRFWDLNPFFTFSDSRNFFSGNPDLDPEFTDSYEIGHLKFWEKASFSSSIYYRHTTGKIERIRTVDAEGNSTFRPQNLSTEDSYGVEFTTSYTPVDWWKLDGSFNFFRSKTDGSNLGESFKSDTYSWFTRLTSKFSPTKKTDIQLRGNYEAPQDTPQGRRRANYTFDIAASQDLMKGKATLTLNARDVLNSRRWKNITYGDSFYTVSDSQWRGRQINLTLNYRINQKKQRRNNDRENGFDGGDGMEF